jgi:hypothetical protein
MSRTRQQPNEMDLWLFKMGTVDTDGHIENEYNAIGIQFRAVDLGMKTRNEIDSLSGRVLQSGTVVSYKTYNQIGFDIGDNISEIPNPTRKDLSTIVKISSKPQNKRGARHNTTRVIEYTIEVS